MTDGVSVSWSKRSSFLEPTSRSKDSQDYYNLFWPISPSTPAGSSLLPPLFLLFFVTWNCVSLICYVPFFYRRKKRRLFIVRYRGGEFLEGCLFHDKWNSLAMPATIGLREPGSLKIRVCRLQLSSLSSLVLWHLSLHTFIPQTKVTKSGDSWCRPPQRPFVKRGDMWAGKGVKFVVSLAATFYYALSRVVIPLNWKNNEAGKPFFSLESNGLFSVGFVKGPKTEILPSFIHVQTCMIDICSTLKDTFWTFPSFLMKVNEGWGCQSSKDAKVS